MENKIILAWRSKLLEVKELSRNVHDEIRRAGSYFFQSCIKRGAIIYKKDLNYIVQPVIQAHQDLQAESAQKNPIEIPQQLKQLTKWQ